MRAPLYCTGFCPCRWIPSPAGSLGPGGKGQFPGKNRTRPPGNRAREREYHVFLVCFILGSIRQRVGSDNDYTKYFSSISHPGYIMWSFLECGYEDQYASGVAQEVFYTCACPARRRKRNLQLLLSYQLLRFCYPFFIFLNDIIFRKYFRAFFQKMPPPRPG